MVPSTAYPLQKILYALTHIYVYADTEVSSSRFDVLIACHTDFGQEEPSHAAPTDLSVLMNIVLASSSFMS